MTQALSILLARTTLMFSVSFLTVSTTHAQQCFNDFQRNSTETELSNVATQEGIGNRYIQACRHLNTLIDMLDEDIERYKSCGNQALAINTQSLRENVAAVMQKYNCD
jgi:hypothetical protein